MAAIEEDLRSMQSIYRRNDFPGIGFSIYGKELPDKMNQKRMQLMRLIYESGFAVDDVVLFLDTHPCSQEALAYYHDMRTIYKKAVREYEENFGPLTAESVDIDNQWTWTQEPWPWEVGAC
jgi:spore coat protein JB